MIFIKEVRFNTVEEIRNLAKDVLRTVCKKQIDKFELYIRSAEKNDFFDESESEFYENLDELRRLRNRIHIQNTKNDFEPDEIRAFNRRRKILAERALEKTLRTMATKFSRKHDYVRDFELPWNAHFND